MAPGDRTCVVCRSPVSRDDSIRFVLGLEATVTIDWKRSLPGTGASCCWRRACLEGSRRPGCLQRAFGRSVQLPGGDWPMSAVRERGVRRQRELMGLAARAGELKAGQDVVDRFVRKGWPQYLVRASDCWDKTAAVWDKKAASGGLSVLASSLNSEAMGAALGRKGPRTIVALGKGPISRALHRELKQGAALL